MSAHGFSRAVSLAKSIPPLGAEGFCGRGFSLCVFPVGGSPGFQSGEARLWACAKKRKHAKGFSPGPAPSGTAIPGCAPTITIAATGKSDNGATALTRTPVAEVYPEVRGEPACRRFRLLSESQIPIPIGRDPLFALSAVYVAAAFRLASDAVI